MSFSPVFLQAIMSIAIMVGIGVAVMGQVRFRQTQEWQGLAEVRLGQIKTMEGELDACRRRLTALEAELAEIKLLNLALQRELQEHRRGRRAGAS